MTVTELVTGSGLYSCIVQYQIRQEQHHPPKNSTPPPLARKPRLHENGGVYHVMLRGNGGQGIFFDDDDRYHFTFSCNMEVLIRCTNNEYRANRG